MNILSPSILASDLLHLEDEIRKTEKAGAKYVHIDVMDGNFVPNISFGMPVISSVRKCTDLVLDVHAMISNPLKYVNDFINCGIDILTFHIEAVTEAEAREIIRILKNANKKVGISVKPNTNISTLVPYINDIDMVLVMTVEPGFGGQRFIESTVSKIEEIRKLSKTIDIEVDGGINLETVKTVSKAGANIFVLGTAFYKAQPPITAEELFLCLK